MATLIELTLKKTSLNNILKSVITNSDNNLLNGPCKDILAKDIVQYKPKQLTHCYSIKELVTAIQL